MSKVFSKKKNDGQYLFGEVRFSYCHVFEPRKNEDGTVGKYDVCCLFPKSDTKTYELLKEAVQEAKEYGKSAKWGGKIPGGQNMNPIKDGDDQEGEEFHDMWYFNAKSVTAPKVQVKDSVGIVDALDDDDFYSGCWGVIYARPYAYASDANKGISIGLNQVIKTRDDERLGGGSYGVSEEEAMNDLA